MGCVCAKGINGDDHVEKKKRRQQQRESQSLKRLVSSSKSDEIAVADVDAGACNDGSTTRLISNSHEHVVMPLPVLSVEEEKKEEAAVVLEKTRKLPSPIRSNADVGVKGTEPNSKASGARIVEEPDLTISSVPNGFKGEHVAAGWPSWLTSVAGEAVKGWLPRRADSFEKLNKIGQGTYSSVYKARDLVTGKLVALKKVRFVNIDAESVRFMAREIHILRRLEHPNVINLEALVTSRMSCNLYLVFEYMEHDLAGIAGTPGIRFTESQVKCYMQQLLSGLDHCHSHGVLHRDIKCANLLINNNGVLKIADFGLATFYNPNHKQHLTSRVVTLWYRPPELLLGATEYGVAVDLWSAGCILAELLAGRPIMPGRTEVEQLHKIFKLCGSPSEQFWRTSKLPHATSFKPQQPYPRCIHDTFSEFPSSALALLDCLLAVEPAGRGTAASALKSEFFTTKPFACDPSSLPKYPPSKEYDVKLRNEEARRQREAATKASGSESGRRKEMPVPANVEFQRQQTQRNASYSNYNAKEDMSSGLQVNSRRGTAENGFSHRGRSGHLYTAEVPNMLQGRGPELSITSGPVVTRSNTARLDRRESARHLPRQQSGARYSLVDETSEKQEWTDHLLNGPPLSHRKDDKAGDNEPTLGYDTQKNRILYSGPLMPPGGNMDEMLKEHERQIQQAVRRARFDKTKTKGQGQRGLSESLLYASRNGGSDH